MVRNEFEGLLGILGGLILDLRGNHDALNRERGTRDGLGPRQMSKYLLDVVGVQILLNNRAQVILRAVPPAAELLRDVGGQIRVGEQHRRGNQRVNRRRMIPPDPGGTLLNIHNHVGQRNLSRTRHHFNCHKPIISRRADKTATKNNVPAGRLGHSFRFNREDCCELPIFGLRIR